MTPRSLKLPQHGKETVGLALVERRIRLIEDQEPRPFEKHARKLDELLLADAEPADRGVDVHIEAEPIQELTAHFLHCARRDQSAAQGFAIDKEIG